MRLYVQDKNEEKAMNQKYRFSDFILLTANNPKPELPPFTFVGSIAIM